MKRSDVQILLLLVVAFAGTALGQQDRFQPEIPRETVAQVEKARSLERAGQSAQALSLLQAVTKANPDYFRAQYNLGIVLAETKDFAGASSAFKAAVALKEKKGIPDATVYNSAGWAYLLAGDYVNAEAALKKAEQSSSQLSLASKRRVFNNLGLLYLYTGDTKKSEEYLKKASSEFGSTLAIENLQLLNTVKAARAQAKK